MNETGSDGPANVGEQVEIEIRVVASGMPRVTADEIAGFHALVSEPEQREWDPGGEQLDLDAVAAFLGRITPSRPGQAVFLAKANSAVVGMSAVFTGLVGPARIGFGVSSGWQRLGLGRLLIDHALAHARRSGIEKIVAEVLPHNLRAISLLRKTGFDATRSWAGADRGLMSFEIEP